MRGVSGVLFWRGREVKRGWNVDVELRDLELVCTVAGSGRYSRYSCDD